MVNFTLPGNGQVSQEMSLALDHIVTFASRECRLSRCKVGYFPLTFLGTRSFSKNAKLGNDIWKSFMKGIGNCEKKAIRKF